MCACSLMTHDCPQPSDRKEDWAGLCLANDEVLSAYELHEEFTKEGSDLKESRTRLMVLCACSSGAVPRECDLWCCLSCQYCLVHFADDGAESRSRPSQARGSARLWPNSAGRRHSMSAGIQVGCPRQREHRSHDTDLFVYGSEQGWAVGQDCSENE